MYRFSRSIYRDLAPYVIADQANANGSSNGHANGIPPANGNGNGNAPGDVADNRRRLLEACEAAMRRLAYDRRYFAHPARSLFSEVRIYFPIQEQDRVFRVVERNVKLAIEHLERLPEDGIGLDGQPHECRAHTRKGTPCQRQPLPGRDYCPSHKHLEESLEPVDELETLDSDAVEQRDVVGAAA
jgi:hypothetical protein